MKKLLIILGCSFLFTGLLAFTPHQLQNQTASYQEYQQKGGPIPDLDVVSEKGKHFTNKDLKEGNFFLVMFNPTCGHCIKMTHLIGSNSDLFKNNQVVFMAAPGMEEYIPAYQTETEIYLHPEMMVGVDHAAAVQKLFNYETLPQINVYDSAHKLLGTYNGDTPLDSLKQYLN